MNSSRHSSQHLVITGGKKLKGSLSLPGAKNSITKLLVASVLSDQPTTFTHVPCIDDVEITLKLCKEIGSEYEWNRSEGTLTICTPSIKTGFIPQRFSGANRIPILMLGALLGRTGEDIIVPTVGGCYLGKRPVDFHIQALEALGAEIEYRSMKHEGAYFARAHRGLRGAEITLNYPSVGATENALLAGVRAHGTTTIYGAAIEPEVTDLIAFLQKMGASIEILGERTIRMRQSHLDRSVTHEVIPDRNVAVSYACAALATGGDISILRARHSDLLTFCRYLTDIGAGWEVIDGGMRFYTKGPLTGGVHIETNVHPGFMTDWQQPFSVLLTQSRGISITHETVYENRFGYLKTLQEMGASLQTYSECMGSTPCRFMGTGNIHSSAISGPTPLKSREIVIPDLRGGFAYVIAALIAEGTSRLYNTHFLTRGYERIVETLSALGADIALISQEQAEASVGSPGKKRSRSEDSPEDLEEPVTTDLKVALELTHR